MFLNKKKYFTKQHYHSTKYPINKKILSNPPLCFFTHNSVMRLPFDRREEIKDHRIKRPAAIIRFLLCKESTLVEDTLVTFLTSKAPHHRILL
jgi:hypothetical protein